MRLFTFGCSFTRYTWPTWADIIGHDLGCEFYNYGIAGLGNVGIAARIIEADIKHKFTEDDLIYISWTSWIREDRFIKGQWEAHGNVFNNSFYDKKFIKKYWDWDNDVIKNATAIISTNKIYKDLIKKQLSTRIIEHFQVNLSEIDTVHKLDLYRDHLPETVNWDYIWKTYENLNDGHPDIPYYLQTAENLLERKIKPETEDYMMNLHKRILTADMYDNIENSWRKNDDVKVKFKK